jgi:hypothetical protein
MRHEIGHSHVASENKGDHARIGADEEENAANDLDHALDLEERRVCEEITMTVWDAKARQTAALAAPTHLRPEAVRDIAGAFATFLQGVILRRR